MTTTNKVSAKIKGTFVLAFIALSIIMAGNVSAKKDNNMKNKTLICHLDENGAGEIIVNNNHVCQHLQHGDNVGPCVQDGGTPPAF